MPGTHEDRKTATLPLETEGTGSCVLQCRSWEVNLGPLREQQGPLTAKSSLQPSDFVCLRLLFLPQSD